jgi:N-acetylated-alpha-linked acidic dipeptidase
MNKPVGRKVDILGDAASEGSPRPVEWSAKLREDIVEGDPTSIYRDEVPVFHGLSISGDVTGRIIYAGYGRKPGVDVKGSIALVKYGGVFRGLKIKAAQEAGAVGCLIFTDPGDDGEVTVKNGYEMYPDGPARQESSVQRGSVQFISKVGDLNQGSETRCSSPVIPASTLATLQLPVPQPTPTRPGLNSATCHPFRPSPSRIWTPFPC